jgi:bisphosphoglycerate-independent phosphoglycerate mutase (AlkP superfamily)
MGPGVKRDFRMMGLAASVYDIAPTLLHIYGIEQPKQMRGRVLTEVFDNAENKVAASK